jgi:hypothetical protein
VWARLKLNVRFRLAVCRNTRIRNELRAHSRRPQPTRSNEVAYTAPCRGHGAAGPNAACADERTCPDNFSKLIDRAFITFHASHFFVTFLTVPHSHVVSVLPVKAQCWTHLPCSLSSWAWRSLTWLSICLAPIGLVARCLLVPKDYHFLVMSTTCRNPVCWSATTGYNTRSNTERSVP